MNCAPDADLASVGEENFEWVVSNMAEALIEIVTSGRKLELTGTWPQTLNTSKDVETAI